MAFSSVLVMAFSRVCLATFGSVVRSDSFNNVVAFGMNPFSMSRFSMRGFIGHVDRDCFFGMRHCNCRCFFSGRSCFTSVGHLGMVISVSGNRSCFCVTLCRVRRVVRIKADEQEHQTH